MQLTSTRDAGLRVSFRDAVVANVPADGGLFVPVALPRWDDVEALCAQSWVERNAEILGRLLAGEFTRGEVAELAARALDFPVPLVPFADGTFILELFHGPSAAFKDVGARFLAAILAALSASGTVLTATSGDTGAAVAAAFREHPAVRVVVLYPAGRISELQERQLVGQGANILALAVTGSFDDCQRLARGCFADPDLTQALGLLSANSINIARLLPQVLYYFEAVALLRGLGEARSPLVAVPCGNFGNLCAGLYAQALGLPVAAFLAATNANRTVPDYLDGGPWRPRPSVATLSNAMDVGAPSNWERIEHLHGGSAQALRQTLRWGSLGEEETVASLRNLWGRGYPADPHTAVAAGVLASRRRAGEPAILLATAHPAKFPALATLGLVAPLPASLAALPPLPPRREEIPADLPSLKARLRS